MRLKEVISRLQDFYSLSMMAPMGVFHRPFYMRETIEQLDHVGVGSFLIVFLVSLFIGMALSLQISAQLSALGLKMYTGRILGLSIISEIGPVSIAVSFAGRVGAGMAAEIGSMVLGHQVDALRVHGVSPIKKLVAPRVLSALIMLPVLTVIGDAVSLVGGYYIAVFVSNQNGSFYWSQISTEMDFQSVVSGIIKPFIFGYLIACISCYVGLSTRGGAKGLGRATTTAVVISIVTIIATDFVISRILLYAFGLSI